ncbi:MAG: phosphoenolpyruvate-utilizing N-terminal domain-containing protein [Ruminococcus bicirculans (ex Wegman et al. 2014)]
MTKYTGKGVYGAVAMGKISVFKKQDTAIKRIHTEDSEGEKKRVAKAKQAATEQLQSIYDKALREVGETNAQIFEIHMMMLEDDDYNESIENIIDSQKGQRRICSGGDGRQLCGDVCFYGRSLYAGKSRRCKGYFQQDHRKPHGQCQRRLSR